MISNYRQSSENLGVTQECAKFVKSCFLVQTNLPGWFVGLPLSLCPESKL